MTADVYTHAPYIGRGGWSWYTGSAAWMHRAAVESICGLQVQANRVRLSPQIPAHWPGVELTLRRNGRVHVFCICRASAQDRLDAAQARGAVPLAAGEWLNLEALEEGGDVAGQQHSGTCHLVVLDALTKAEAGLANAPP